MKSNTQIIVVFTLINGRKNYVAGGHSKSQSGKWLVNFSINVMDAKVFDTNKEADEFIPTINNPHQRVFSTWSETVEFSSVKERHQFEKLS